MHSICGTMTEADDVAASLRARIAELKARHIASCIATVQASQNEGDVYSRFRCRHHRTGVHLDSVTLTRFPNADTKDRPQET